jgi:acetyl esterase
MRWFYSHYLTDPAHGMDPMVSPIRAENLAGLPPAFVITAEYDPLRDQGVAYADAMRGAGNDCEGRTYAGLFHGFLSMIEWIDSGKVAFDDAVTALNRGFGRT